MKKSFIKAMVPNGQPSPALMPAQLNLHAVGLQFNTLQPYITAAAVAGSGAQGTVNSTGSPNSGGMGSNSNMLTNLAAASGQGSHAVGSSSGSMQMSPAAAVLAATVAGVSGNSHGGVTPAIVR